MAYYKDLSLFGEKTAAIDENGRYVSYKYIDEFSKHIKDIMEERSLVFLFCQNKIDSLAGYIAFLGNNIVPVLIDSHMNQELIEVLLNTYQPEYLYLPKEMQEYYIECDCIESYTEYCLLKTKYHNKGKLYGELGLLLTTSGSTGSPKLVRQSYHNIESNAEAIAEYLKLDEKERPISTLPMNYTYGLSIINSHLLKGATILLTDKSLMEKGFWEFFKKEKATSFGGVPYTYEMLKRLHYETMDLSSLHTMTQAGGKLSPELHKEFAEYAKDNNIHFVVMYGQTEATARMSYLPYEKSIEKYGSMGVAIPGGTFILIDTQGCSIENANVTGELVYQGPNVTLGYAQSREDLAKGDERNGVLVTGDMAKRDEEGYYYIVGRKKRFLKIFGNRVNLDEVEGLLKTEFKNVEFACTGMDDKMVVFMKGNNSITQDVKLFLANKTGLNHSAFTIEIIDEIPKNEAGKTLYSMLKV